MITFWSSNRMETMLTTDNWKEQQNWNNIRESWPTYKQNRYCKWPKFFDLFQNNAEWPMQRWSKNLSRRLSHED